MTLREAKALMREEWNKDKADVICGMMNCNCPGDEHGADMQRAICVKAAAFIDGLQAAYFLIEQSEKAAKAV